MLSHAEKNAAKNKLVAVAIDRDKGSQGAMKWAVDSILSKGQTVLLLHVKLKQLPGSSNSSPSILSFSMFFHFSPLCLMIYIFRNIHMIFLVVLHDDPCNLGCALFIYLYLFIS